MGSGLQPFQIDAYLTKKIIQDLVIECANATQVIIKSGSVAGADDGSVVMEAAADITVAITSSGVNGLDTGSEAANTWYYIYLIRDPDTGLVRGLLSASATSPTMPSGYTQKRLIGAVRNDGSNNFITFLQVDNEVRHITLLVYNATIGTSWVSVDASNYMPPISRRALVFTRFRHISGSVDEATLSSRLLSIGFEWLIGFIDGTLAAGIYHWGLPVIVTESNQQYQIKSNKTNHYAILQHVGFLLDL